jgi:hypothetical protein
VGLPSFCIPPCLLFAERKTNLVFVPAVFFSRIEFLSFFLFFLSFSCVIVVCVCRGSSSPRSLACSLVHSRATFLPSSLCVWFFWLRVHTVLKFRVVCCASVDALVRFLGFCCRFPAPLSTQPALRTQLWFFIFYRNGIPLGLSPLFCFSLSLSLSPVCAGFLVLLLFVLQT